ncbi:hypothetical protein [Abditibacterium utsteinense]|uniref:hypothetical protein n=1 Tax=Abditibacterium utsteinense TaxID=1960156 RepID=UPI000D08C5C0|nr:hypothetical protein [Abditibacterium utsteinense]
MKQFELKSVGIPQKMKGFRAKSSNSTPWRDFAPNRPANSFAGLFGKEFIERFPQKRNALLEKSVQGQQ